MNVLAVLAHPNRDSFTGGLVDSFVESLADAGHAQGLGRPHLHRRLRAFLSI
jgi:putative NADPH-quinone reductase